jgi:3-dehydroquinate synthase
MIFLEQYEKICQLLDIFFERGYQRTTVLEAVPTVEVSDIVCRIFKRGLLSHTKDLDFSSDSLVPMARVASFACLYDLIRERFSSLFFIVDKRVLECHPVLGQLFQNYCRGNIYYFQASENNKTLDSVYHILSVFLEDQKRHSIQKIYAIGGGVTLDVAGFVAGLAHAEISYIPTTLLSAVDASIGGKTGVNYKNFGKNQVGMFYPCRELIFIPHFIKTLSLQDIACGVVEAAKHSYLFGTFEQDQFYFEKLLSQQFSFSEYIEIVKKNYLYKKAIVQNDPNESSGLRACLNFGHTVGHILEFLSEQGFISDLPHGLCVAYGMVFLEEVGYLKYPREFSAFIRKMVQQYPFSVHSMPPDGIWERLLLNDKKNTTSQKSCRFVLPEYGCFSEGVITQSFFREFPAEVVVEEIKYFLSEMSRPFSCIFGQYKL